MEGGCLAESCGSGADSAQLEGRGASPAWPRPPPRPGPAPLPGAPGLSTAGGHTGSLRWL